jgi:hypothetical protein
MFKLWQFGFSMQITKKYALEVDLFRFIRQLKDGIDFCEFKFSADFFKADHNPKFIFMAVLFNFKLIEITIYNINHL